MTFKKTLIAAIAAVTLMGAVATPASAGWRGFGYGAAAGLALGVIAASNAYGYGYHCYLTTREFVDDYGYVTYRRVRVCG